MIVVGADTPRGRAVVERLVEPGREVRAFVSDPAAGAELRELGVKVALGDVSDDSHVQGACMNCFTAVLITEAALDGRERCFANEARQVLEGWAAAAAASAVTRVIWVHEGDPPPISVKEVRTVAPDHPQLAAEVAALDNLRFLSQ